MINLIPIFAGDSQLFKVAVYDADGITAVTPSSCTCSVWNADTNVAAITDQAGTVGSGYAQYNWAGIAAAGNYEAVLTVTISAGVIKSEHFRVAVGAKPPVFTNDLGSDIGRVRFELDDTVEGAGPRPDDRNLRDAEIQMLLDREGSVMRAVAAACEMLARAWARAASYSTGQRSEQIGAVAKEWADRGKELRGQYGGASGFAFSVSLDRQDGYSGEADTASEFTS